MSKMIYDPITEQWIPQENSPEKESLNRIQKRESQLSTIQPQRKSQQQIEDKINAHEFYGYAKRLFAHVNKMTDGKMTNLIFRNIKGGHYNPEHKQIVCGYEWADISTHYGFTEYATMRYVWTNHGYFAIGKSEKSMRGKQAMWAFIMHEVAHYFQCEENGIGYRSIHNDCFAENLGMLIDLFPYEDVKNI